VNEKTVKLSPSHSGTEPHNNKSDRDNIRILIVDDQNVVRQRLQMLLEPEPDLAVVGTANDGSKAIKQVESLRPHIVLIDLEMPGMDGVEATRVISKRFPDCRVLVLSSHDSNEYINKAMSAGAKGYLLKSTPAEELTTAIRSVYKGYSHLGPGLFEKIYLAESNSKPDTSAQTSSKEATHPSEKTKESKLFRKESLERLSSPERLDQLMRVVSPRNWLPLFTLGSLVVAAGVWSIVGRIPITIEGRGVLIYPSKVVPLQSRSAGQLQTLNVKEGDVVKKGDVLATVDQVDLRKQLQLAKAKLAQLQAQNRDANSLQMRRINQEKRAIQEQHQTLQLRLKVVRELTPVLREKGLVSIRRDRLNLHKRLQKLQELLPTFKKRLATRQTLFKEGAISDDVLLQARQEYQNNLASIDEAESQLKQLDVKEADALREYLSNLNEVKNIRAQLQELDSKQATLAQQDLETSTNRKKEIQETEREIDQLKEQLSNNSQIISQHSGRILEITVNLGQVVNAGTRIASVDVENPSGKLVGITYFPIEDGKKIQPDMTIQITPQTVKRERFGGIVGTVTNVSRFPITKEAAANVVGNPEVVEGLVSNKQQGLMQVFASLESDPTTFSGYKWSSSSGPKLKISPGTTTIVRIKVDERAPITYVIPLLRSVSGIY
jgi:HlyD family secretion protein